MDKTNLKIIFYISAIFLGAIQAWNTRFYMNPDGISYLDIGDAYFRGDLSTAINAYWSPLYSWILGLFLYIIKPNAYYEFPVVHGVNFLIYFFSIFVFSFFLEELLVFIKQNKSDKFILLPDSSVLIIGYILFLYTTLKFLIPWITTPDLLLTSFVYSIFGLLLKIKNGSGSIVNYVFLGSLLGLSYLTKAVMFPLSILILLSNINRNNVKRIFISFICFILVALPFILSISNQKQRLTFSDAGTLNYVWQVNNVTPYYMVHWQGGLVGETPIHPTRKIFSSPDVFEFSSPINATYPPWFDPSYWYEGVKPNLNPYELFRFLKNNFKEYFLIFIVFQGILIIYFLYLYLKLADKSEFIRNIKNKTALFTPSLIAILIYSLVYPELRYIAPFVVIIWLILFSSLVFNDTKENSQSFHFSTKAIVVFTLLTILIAKLTTSDYCYIREVFSCPANNSNYYIAKELENLGIKNGDSIATFGYGHVAFWARLGRLKIVAEMPDKEIKKFWNLSLSEQMKVIKAFKRTGAKAIVLDSRPKEFNLPWQKLGSTGYYLCFLN